MCTDAAPPSPPVPVPRRWGSRSDNRHEDWKLKKYKKRHLFQQGGLLNAFHPTRWMIAHDGFPIQEAYHLCK